MIDETEAYARLAEVVQVTSRTERISLDQALGRTAATVVRSRLSIPRFDNAMVDGYALPIGEHSPGTTYRVVGEQPAGRDRGFSLGDGEAIRIFTGAPLPKGTGSVIM